MPRKIVSFLVYQKKQFTGKKQPTVLFYSVFLWIFLFLLKIKSAFLNSNQISVNGLLSKSSVTVRRYLEWKLKEEKNNKEKKWEERRKKESKFPEKSVKSRAGSGYVRKKL